MRRTVPPSAEIEAQIDALPGARLIIQRAVEDEFDGTIHSAPDVTKRDHNSKPRSGSDEPIHFEAQLPDPFSLGDAMLDHAGFAVSDYHASKTFYEKALAALGITLTMEPSGQAAGFGRNGRPFFWIEAQGEPVRGRLHVAFLADDRAGVDRFHEAALQAGATDNGAPGRREIYHPHYYGAYVLDPDGNNIEAVCHKPG